MIMFGLGENNPDPSSTRTHAAMAPATAHGHSHDGAAHGHSHDGAAHGHSHDGAAHGHSHSGARKGPPPFLPVILFFALPLIFAIGVTPLLASNHNPAANAGRLRVAVADFDGGAIGLALTSHLARVAGAPGMPGLDVVAAAGTSPEALRREVRDGAAWGALWVRAGASAALDAAMADPAAPYYNGALVFAWDEGRNSMLTPARVAGPVKGALAAFTAAFTTAHLAATAANVSDIARVNPRLLLAPLATAEEVLFPAAQWPVMGVGLTIGNILVAVFSLSITLAVMKGLTPLFLSWRLPPLRLLAVRVLAITAYCGVVSATMATMALGLAGLTSHGDMWARVWVTFWVLQMVFTFYLGAAAALAGPDAVPVFFLFMLLSNIIGGWNTDLADFGCEGRSRAEACPRAAPRRPPAPVHARARATRPAHCARSPTHAPLATADIAFSCTGMYHATSLLRNVLFGSNSSRVGLNVGVLLMWLVVDAALFAAATLWRGRQMAVAAAKATAGVRAAAAAPPTTGRKADPEVAVAGATAASASAVGEPEQPAAGGAAAAAV